MALNCPTLRTGQRVLLQGLANCPDLNGKRGVVVRFKDDIGRYAVRVAGREIAIKPENIQPEGGAARAEKIGAKQVITSVICDPVKSEESWSGQMRAGHRCMVRAEGEMTGESVNLWFGDAGFVRSAPVDVALAIADVRSGPDEWQAALAKTLNHFPIISGRLRARIRQGETSWQIVLNNAGVVFATAFVRPGVLPKGQALQQLCIGERCDLFDRSDSSNVEDDALMRLKLVIEEGAKRGILGLTFNHALCDIRGISMFLRSFFGELAGEETNLDALPSFDRSVAERALESASDPAVEERFTQHWPLHHRAMERWCFLARKLRSGLRGPPDGAATLCFRAPAATLNRLRELASSGGASSASSFEVLVGVIGLKLRQVGRWSDRVLITKDYRSALDAADPGKGLAHLFANVVTHGISFVLSPADAELQDNVAAAELPKATHLAASCIAARNAVDAVTLAYVHWHKEQDHYHGLPNFFGGMCANTWGQSLCESTSSFVEEYAIGARAVDERAANMTFPLDTAYVQILPQPSGDHSVVLTAPLADIKILLKSLPAPAFELPHASEIRSHPWRSPLPQPVVDQLRAVSDAHQRPIRIACTGDSLAACGYSNFLQTLFDKAGLNTQVRNFGVAGATTLRFSEHPYFDENKYHGALEWRPDIVVSTLGTNDARSVSWDREVFVKEYAELVVEFLARNPRPTVFLVQPPPIYAKGHDIAVSIGLADAVPETVAAAARTADAPHLARASVSKIEPPVDVLAKVYALDAFTLLGGIELRRRSYFAEDGVHPNERGTRLLATYVFTELRSIVALKLAQQRPTLPEDDMGF